MCKQRFFAQVLIPEMPCTAKEHLSFCSPKHSDIYRRHRQVEQGEQICDVEQAIASRTDNFSVTESSPLLPWETSYKIFHKITYLLTLHGGISRFASLPSSAILVEPHPSRGFKATLTRFALLGNTIHNKWHCKENEVWSFCLAISGNDMLL